MSMPWQIVLIVSEVIRGALEFAHNCKAESTQHHLPSCSCPGMWQSMLTITDYIASIILGDLEHGWPFCVVLQVEVQPIGFG